MDKPTELEPDHDDFLGALDDILEVIREIRGRTEATKHPGFEFMSFGQEELRDLAQTLNQAYRRLKHPRFILRQEGRDEEIKKLREQVREFNDRLLQQSQRIGRLEDTP